MKSRTIRLPRKAMDRYRMLKQLKRLLREIEQTYDQLDEPRMDRDSRDAMIVVYRKTCDQIGDYRETGIQLKALRR